MNFCQASHLTLFIIAWLISFVNRFLKFSLSLLLIKIKHIIPTGIIKPKWYRNDA